MVILKFEKRIWHIAVRALKLIFDNIFGKKTGNGETKNVSKNVTEQGVQSTCRCWKIDGREFNYTELSDGKKTLFAYVLLFLMSQNKNIKVKKKV
ncbi:MAG: hypothetical protein IPO24_19975 [Bacteroidetes bacterium]|nr:hypothetical protein [Bacteroidota bacterium]